MQTIVLRRTHGYNWPPIETRFNRVNPRMTEMAGICVREVGILKPKQGIQSLSLGGS